MKDIDLFCSYLSQFQKIPYEFFEMPTGSQIKEAINIPKYKQQKLLKQLINLGIIEKINPIVQQNDGTCPAIHRKIRFLKHGESKYAIK